MPASVIFLTGYLALWLPLGLLAWLALAVPRRGSGMAPLLPVALAGAVTGGVLTPLLGAREAWGLLLSAPVAFAFGLAVTAVGEKLSRRRGNEAS